MVRVSHLLSLSVHCPVIPLLLTILCQLPCVHASFKERANYIRMEDNCRMTQLGTPLSFAQLYFYYPTPCSFVVLGTIL